MRSSPEASCSQIPGLGRRVCRACWAGSPQPSACDFEPFPSRGHPCLVPLTQMVSSMRTETGPAPRPLLAKHTVPLCGQAPPVLTQSSPARRQAGRRETSWSSLALSRRPAVCMEMSDGNHLWLEAPMTHLQRYPPGGASPHCPHHQKQPLETPG